MSMQPIEDGCVDIRILFDSLQTWSQPGELPPSATPLYGAALAVENKLPEPHLTSGLTKIHDLVTNWLKHLETNQ